MLSRRAFLAFALLAFALAVAPAVPAQESRPSRTRRSSKPFRKRCRSSWTTATSPGRSRSSGERTESSRSTRSGARDAEAKTPMTKDTLFRIASMTKPVTAIGIMILVRRGEAQPGRRRVEVPAGIHEPEVAGDRRPVRPVAGEAEPPGEAPRPAHAHERRRELPEGRGRRLREAQPHARGNRARHRACNRSSSNRARSGATPTPASTRSAA